MSSTGRGTTKKEKDGYLILMLEDKTICEERTITGHSEVYAENCAENWVLGVPYE
jgi:hypothetical protein